MKDRELLSLSPPESPVSVEQTSTSCKVAGNRKRKTAAAWAVVIQRRLCTVYALPDNADWHLATDDVDIRSIGVGDPENEDEVVGISRPSIIEKKEIRQVHVC
jgi:hypothetical protein